MWQGRQIRRIKMDWVIAEARLKEVISQYTALFGMPQANPFWGLAYLDSLLKRYNSGERTQELFGEMMSCE
jgi:alpha-glucosidase (family GH31 glycosyl hydrolase)